MKQNIHPTYHETVKVTCACGNSFTVGSTVDNISVEICGACHPFYTGKQNIVDTTGRVEKFKERGAKQAAAASTRKGKAVKKQNRAVKKSKTEDKAEKPVEAKAKEKKAEQK